MNRMTPIDLQVLSQQLSGRQPASEIKPDMSFVSAPPEAPVPAPVKKQRQRQTSTPVEKEMSLTDKLSRMDLTPLAALVDSATGSNFARTYRPPGKDNWREKANYMHQLKKDLLNLKSGKGKELSQNTIGKLNEGNAIPAMLGDISTTIKENSASFGPVAGRTWGQVPYNETGRTIDAQVRAASQAFGRFMEGGVLRKEDEEKYRKMFPNLTDTPDVADNKLQVVDRLLVQRQNSNLEAYKAQGYNMSGLDKGMVVPGVPDVIRNGSRSLTSESLKSMTYDQKLQLAKSRGLIK